jgi:hypothetical protein
MIANELLENVAKFINLGTVVTNQNDIHEEIKSRLKAENACYHLAKNILSYIKRTKD